ncbi:MAG: hypothetical protein JXX29_15095 [Deltaproteobacteria bacterium]|nr:hypothetical protein [Deltaproteobacteria bacterium]MBN2673007.1 hypothetical protein [Deltaproteobacteria bacterium]
MKPFRLPQSNLFVVMLIIFLARESAGKEPVFSAAVDASEQPTVVWLHGEKGVDTVPRIWVVSKSPLDTWTVHVGHAQLRRLPLPSSGGAPYVNAFAVQTDEPPFPPNPLATTAPSLSR